MTNSNTSKSHFYVQFQASNPPMVSETSSSKWVLIGSVTNYLAAIIFLFLDFLDAVLCVLYRFLDSIFDEEPSRCYCENRGGQVENVVEDKESEVSETLYGRRNIFREMGFLGKWEKLKKKDGDCGGGEVAVNRWSDCGCESCVSWVDENDGDQKLHVVLKETREAANEDGGGNQTENVIFIHGFLSSSSFWAETVFPQFSQSTNHNYRLFSVDLLGFGRSPKPRDCLYTMSDHLAMIEKSVICPFQLNSFHLVAHSMGCIIATALAAKYSESVKSITLVAPPYSPSSESNASTLALKRFADKRLWPPLSFGSSVMSWYEHVGRCVCFLVCRNHRTWEWILKLVTRKRNLHYLIVDLTRHTHHSAWHTMHNVICGGAKLMDQYLEILSKSGVKINVVHGDRDRTVPLECSNGIKTKIPTADINIIPDADHGTVIVGREEDFVQNLKRTWASSGDVSCRF